MKFMKTETNTRMKENRSRHKSGNGIKNKKKSETKLEKKNVRTVTGPQKQL